MDALGTTCKAQKEYDVLISIINSLNPLLTEAQALQMGQFWEEETKIFRKIATNIETFVANFVESIARFDGKLAAETPNWVARVGAACRKVEWTFLKPLVQDFICQLNTHVLILSATFSMLQLYVGALLGTSLLWRPSSRKYHIELLMSLSQKVG